MGEEGGGGRDRARLGRGRVSGEEEKGETGLMNVFSSVQGRSDLTQSPLPHSWALDRI